MKLHVSTPSAANTITGYGDDYVMVNGERHQGNVIITSERIVEWSAADFQNLKEQDFAALTQMGLEIVLLGTGPRQRFPHPRLTAPLAQARVGLEVMDLKAACRTYNILVAEERKVALALLFQ